MADVTDASISLLAQLITRPTDQRKVLGLKRLGQLDAARALNRPKFDRRTTNAYKAEHDPLFRKACELAKCLPTRRQYSKYSNQRGQAYQYKNQAREALNG